MTNILVTGASGFVGSALIPKLIAKGDTVYALSRHPPAPIENLIPLAGDITAPNLGLRQEDVPDIAAVYHLAGLHMLGKDEEGSIWKTNVDGTKNVLDFCINHGISRLFFVSTAYTWEVNPYGRSKIQNEKDIAEYAAATLLPSRHGLKITIFKPSIIIGTEEHPYPGHFSRFVSLLIKINKRGEPIRRKLEGTLRLPIVEPIFRIRGNPDGRLNLVTVDDVAEAMASIKEPGTYWLTNPSPPMIRQLAEWIGEFIMVTLRFQEEEFKPRLIEAQFAELAAVFEPYLRGDNFPSDLKGNPITREFIQDTIKRSLA